MSAENFFAVLQQLTPMARAAKHLAAVLQKPARPSPTTVTIPLARDEMVEIDRHCELMLTEAGHRLNLLMAMCLPATAIASILSMNAEQRWGNVWKLVLIAGVLGALVMSWVSRSSPPKKQPIIAS